ncbi:hypothetical protein LCGC14_0507400 [marine sediment metagenome]|uniref:Uncharacterized protein n=1 Tax=marine sediment metagenome TaxID=412755 RepID=A0A0F9SKK9_9ZZZZ
MVLSVLDRVILLTILPKEGNYLTLKILMDLRMTMSFTESEMKQFNLKIDDETGQTTWENAEDVEVPIGEKATDIIIEALGKLDQEGSLNPEMIDTYEKFISPTE